MHVVTSKYQLLCCSEVKWIGKRWRYDTDGRHLTCACCLCSGLRSRMLFCPYLLGMFPGAEATMCASDLCANQTRETRLNTYARGFEVRTYLPFAWPTKKEPLSCIEDSCTNPRSLLNPCCAMTITLYPVCVLRRPVPQETEPNK